MSLLNRGLTSCSSRGGEKSKLLPQPPRDGNNSQSASLLGALLPSHGLIGKGVSPTNYEFNIQERSIKKCKVKEDHSTPCMDLLWWSIIPILP